ncbi:MAG: ribonucleoside triphosphate reductase, partial [Clostridia bacterium]|nr:ribonucleoside triphosphate reductase [Clostridia bacterium]
DIITANMNGDSYYTNSSHLPVGYTEDIFSALDIQDELQILYTSGTVFHAFLGEKLPDWRAAATLVRKIAENYRLPYYTMSPTYSVCKNHGYLVGEQYTCPECGGKTEVYSRITGYYRPVQNWNTGKSQEFKDRKVYNIANSKLTHVGPLSGEGVSVPTPVAAPQQDRLLLFTTKTCPNCRMACMLLDKAGISYEKIDAEEHAGLTREYGVQQAPTLAVISGGQTTLYANASNIKGFIETYQKA